MARNLGMELATGDVIVFLTADTKLSPDYLEKILPYYQQGYDWVTVQSCSYNTDSVYSLFVEIQHRFEDRKPGFDPYTTQGYSVRRDAALEVGLISGGIYPVNTCRDWSLGKKLSEQGYKKVYDRSIVVPHKSPDNFSEFWQVRKTRGLMSAYQPYFMFQVSLKFLCFRFIAKDILAILQFFLIVPSVVRVIAMVRNADHPARYFFPIYYTYFIHTLARCIGEWQGIFHILRLRPRR
jgi:cellulose synthase/poly-beta-1,6-N-acetylglucosamine synthase-like glycosyltransferase